MVGAMDGLFAYLVEPVLKKIFAGKDVSIFFLIPVGIIVLFAIRGICRYIYDTSIKLAGQKAIQDIRNDLYAGTIRQDMAFFNRQATGDLMSCVTNDITTMQEGMGQVVTGLFRDVISFVALLGVIFYRNWQLAIISFVVIPLTAYPAQLIGNKIKNAARRSLDLMGGLGVLLQESFSGIKVIKAFGVESHITEKFKVENKKYLFQYKRFIKYSSMAMPVSEMITSFGIAAVVYVGGSFVLSGKMSASEFFSFIAAMIMLYTPLKKLQNAYNVVQRSAGAAERVFKLLDEQPSIIDCDGATTIERSEGVLEFRNVTFSYGDEPIINDISFRVEHNQMIALVGSSGGGKSTIAALAMRFHDVNTGAILLDGRDLRTIARESLNKQFAFVDQETILFNDTIYDNIRFGNPQASSEEIFEVAKAAYAHDFIMQLPDGYQTTIGDRGMRLSGGQRQRLCIARALLRNAPILILDEATSALDTESERMVQSALDNLTVNRTTIVIAHRLSTIVNADLIIVLENGYIVEKGIYNDLIANNGMFSRLHALQFTEQNQKYPA
jgi:subfamily B ATP-binding cassette protein MsbA